MHLNLFLAAACLASSVVAQTKLKISMRIRFLHFSQLPFANQGWHMWYFIVPLGDSITEITCWRPLVWDSLIKAGVADKVQFVGSMTNNPQNCQGPAGWDMHHEGHSGYLAIDIANRYLTNWLSTTKPDIVMFMLGTNDVVQQSKSTADILAAYTKMVGQMRAVTPKVKVIVRIFSSFQKESLQYVLWYPSKLWARSTLSFQLASTPLTRPSPPWTTPFPDGCNPPRQQTPLSPLPTAPKVSRHRIWEMVFIPTPPVMPLLPRPSRRS